MDNNRASGDAQTRHPLDFSSPEAINCQYLLSQYGTSRAPPALMIEFLHDSKLFKPSTGNHIHLEGVNGMAISCEEDSVYSPLSVFSEILLIPSSMIFCEPLFVEKG